MQCITITICYFQRPQVPDDNTKHDAFRLRNRPSLMVLNMLSTPVEDVAREFDGRRQEKGVLYGPYGLRWRDQGTHTFFFLLIGNTEASWSAEEGLLFSG